MINPQLFRVQKTQYGMYWWLKKYEKNQHGVFAGKITEDDKQMEGYKPEHKYIVEQIKYGGISDFVFVTSVAELERQVSLQKKWLLKDVYPEALNEDQPLSDALTPAQKKAGQAIKDALEKVEGHVAEFKVENWNKVSDVSKHVHYAMYIRWQLDRGHQVSNLYGHAVIGKNGGLVEGSIRRYSTTRKPESLPEYLKWIRIMT